MPMRRPCIELLRIWKRTYVRGLDWCNPDSSGLKKRWSEGDPGACRHIPTPKKNAPDKIGVVAAISKNRVIGVCGELPWDIPEDRKHFEALTSGKILIIGRRTFGEREDGAHLAHIGRCIVVSNTLDPQKCGSTLIATSLDDALDQAKQIIMEQKSTLRCGIHCWVGGGERLYEEALAHTSLHEVHLTEIDTEIDINSGIKKFARFPAKYRWDRNFRLLEKRMGNCSGQGALPKYSFSTYRRE